MRACVWVGGWGRVELKITTEAMCKGEKAEASF
jgi:hypothetical protein